MAENNDQEALNQLIQGKRHLLIKDYYSAVQSFEKVCRLFDEKYGKGSDECGDAYLNYGIALLELARQETGAIEGLVNAKINDPSESASSNSGDEEEEEGDDEENGDEDNQNGDQNPQEDTNDDEQKEDNEEDLSGEESQKNEYNSNANSEQSYVNLPNSSGSATNGSLPVQTGTSQPIDPNQPSTSTGVTKGQEEDDEPTNIEISWEVLSMARSIFEKQLREGQDVRFKLAETLQKLGEIATEWENNELAIELLNHCLNLRTESLPEDDRLIAETYYHIGNAHSFISQVDEANDCFQKAILVIKKRIENQKAILENRNTQSEDVLDSIKDEIRDLEDLLPEMISRIEDKRDQMATVEEALKMEAKEKDEQAKIDSLKLCEPKPINNVSHLVKRKKPDQGNEGSQKKLCTKNSTDAPLSDVVTNSESSG